MVLSFSANTGSFKDYLGSFNGIPVAQVRILDFCFVNDNIHK
jgi:hypothetical protein